MTKKLLSYEDILEVPFDKERVTHILDVGAGSGAWTLDVARIPEIKARSSPTSSNPIKLYMSDITSAKFPSSSILDSLNIAAFEQDVTKPFPEEMQGKFDVVHMSFLVWALTHEQWSLALKNIYNILSKLRQ
jgi:SAM-dependent methyltransferase